MSSEVRFDDVSLVYPGTTRPAVSHLNLDIAQGEFLVLVGPSGCGKSTSLRMLAGLEPVSSGNIYIGEKDVTRIDPKDRDIAMVFQNYALYPHMSVADNMAFALHIQKMPKDEIERRVKEAADLLDLTQYLDRKPKALSGGQRQRVAMGRAIVREPEVFLMDEPLSNLDAKLRVQTRTQIASLQRRLGTTTLYVTHDQVEAMTMGDRIAVLKDGLLQQVGSPSDLYNDPANIFVAGFIGSPAMNIIEMPLVEGGVGLAGRVVPVATEIVSKATADGSKTVMVGFRPEDVRMSGDATGWPVEVDVVESLGADAYVYGGMTLPGGERREVVVRTDGRDAPRKGQMINIEVVRDHAYYFATNSGERLRVS
ncbi:MAG: sn-glycerol-3-phosphate ABC transporter ATP-binding protein UgpC [Candidatus Nanopelagicales bacterium]